MSDGSWELTGGPEGRKNYSLCSLSSFSSGLENAGTGESVKLQTQPILQQRRNCSNVERERGVCPVSHTQGAVPRVHLGEMCALHKTQPVQHPPGKKGSFLREERN